MPPLGEVVHATTKEQVRDLLHAVKDKILVVDYFAEWCGPCIKFAPSFSKLAGEFAETSVFVKVNVDQVPEAAEAQEVQSLPTFVLFFNGHRQADCVGASYEKLRSVIEEVQRKTAVTKAG
jgi:thioredoxin 1